MLHIGGRDRLWAVIETEELSRGDFSPIGQGRIFACNWLLTCLSLSTSRASPARSTTSPPLLSSVLLPCPYSPAILYPPPHPPHLFMPFLYFFSRPKFGSLLYPLQVQHLPRPPSPPPQLSLVQPGLSQVQHLFFPLSPQPPWHSPGLLRCPSPATFPASISTPDSTNMPPPHFRHSIQF